MEVLVTGGTGFLGSAVVRALDARGDTVRVLVRRTSDRTRLAGLDVTESIGDVTDAESVRRAVEGVELVIHCAAAVEFGPRDPSVLERINVGGTEHVLGAAADAGVDAVHVSSLAALGPTPADAPAKDESWWCHDEPGTAYERTKRRAHLVARSLADTGAPVRIAMPGGIYGYGDESTMASLIRSYALVPWPVGYLPEVRQSLVNVDDCADAVLRIAGAPAGTEWVVVADVVNIRTWLSFIADAAGHVRPFLYVPTRTVEALGGPGGTVASWFGASPTMVPETVRLATQDTAYVGTRLRTELGWEPRPVRAGMQQMVDAIRAEAPRFRSTRRVARARQRSTRL